MGTIYMKEKLSTKLYEFAHILELILAIFIAIGVVIGFVGLVNHLIEFYQSDVSMSYDVFKHFLSYVLILVVGVEFILMLLTHSIKVTAELIVFVIARKMLIYGSTMLDMVLGSLALAITFGTLKFILHSFEKDKEESHY